MPLRKKTAQCRLWSAQSLSLIHIYPKGFFLMTESGKIDWACHANDAAASIHDVLEMSHAVQAAVEFQNKHPNDTLILVTADLSLIHI